MSLPQREGRPKLDILPEDSLPSTAGWAPHYDNLGANDLNNPVDKREGSPKPNGWQDEFYDVNQSKDVD